MQPGFHVATLSPTLHLVQYDPMKMSSDLSALQIQRVDARQGSAEILQELRLKLSPQGDVVSPRGRALTEEVFGEALTPVEVVQKICRDVREDGTEALLRYNKALDKADLSAEQLRVPQSELEAAHSAADPALLDSVRRIRDNVAEFQQAILHSDVTLKPRPGVSLTQRYLPLKRIGVCVPGGAAAYPSTVLMTAVPAQVAGVEEIAVVAPPTKFGAYNVDMLATCHELGLREVYRVGGAQAVAAMAYGCDVIPAVDKIVGPGNLFVALAKKEAYGVVDIDSFAGPSEVIIIADETARADFVVAASTLAAATQLGDFNAVAAALRTLIAAAPNMATNVNDDDGSLTSLASDVFAEYNRDLMTDDADDVTESVFDDEASVFEEDGVLSSRVRILEAPNIDTAGIERLDSIPEDAAPDLLEDLLAASL